MLYYDRIDISEGIDLAKRNNIKECMICHCWFFNHGLKFQDYVCNGCDNLSMLFLNISDIDIIIVKNQFLIFKPLSYCFEKTIEFDIKASFSSRPVSHLTN